MNMIKGKKGFVLIPAGDYSRVVQTPYTASEDMVLVVRQVPGVVLHTPKIAGKSEIYFEIDVNWEPALVEENVKFLLEQHIKREL